MPQTPIAAIPAIQQEPWALDWWLPRHQAKITERQQMNNQVDLLFVGDSIIHAWEDKGRVPWQRYYAHRRALNLGFAGDRTENLLWRLHNGAIDELSPKLVILLIGTNNAGFRMEASSDTAIGIKTILDTLRDRLSAARILLQAIFPRGYTCQDPYRALTEGTNRLIWPYADNQHIFFSDINHLFLDEQGGIHRNVMEDGLHPNANQYPRWAEAIEADVARLLAL